jgi:hypothetical protein
MREATTFPADKRSQKTPRRGVVNGLLPIKADRYPSCTAGLRTVVPVTSNSPNIKIGVAMVRLTVELEFAMCPLSGAQAMADAAWKRPNAGAAGRAARSLGL